MKRLPTLLKLFTACACMALAAAPAAAQTVKVTPLGGIDGEFCPQDRALVFEDPNGTRVLVEFMAGQLRALGLETGPMSGFDAGEVDKAFFADTPAVKTNFICTLGHGDPASIYDRLPRPDFDTFNRLA